MACRAELARLAVTEGECEPTLSAEEWFVVGRGFIVKSNIVNNLCKDMVYTFCVTLLCIWKLNGA